MFLIPLNQIESVELVIHALKMAGGEADCSTCPARQVCMKQCLTIASSVEQMLAEGTLPSLGSESASEKKSEPQAGPEQKEKSGTSDGPAHLKVIK